MSEKTTYKVLISGGGTGGHIFPAVSIANALRRRDPKTEILFVGAENRMEMEKVPAAGYDIVGLPISGFDRKRIWRNFKVLYRLWKSLRRARKILLDFRPDIAIGVGGYASGPVLKQAQRLGIPTILQEQNSYAGVTNNLLAAKADAICVAYRGLGRFFPAVKIWVTGNPVRADILNVKESREQAKIALGFSADKPLILVLGGSLGARTINQEIEASIEQIEATGANLLWQTGKLYIDKCAKVAEGHQSVRATAFISRMDLAYRAADIVVSRAGAGTISELQLVGLPAILIPSPNVAEDHQRKNAMALVERKAAVMILDADCRNDLAKEIQSLLADEKKRQKLSENISGMALRESDERIVDCIYCVLKDYEYK